ncbi:MAG: alpha/beta hydrolase [Patescibacteria group bacterium]|nr:alpha/beta hydrolase [Patescibacteria group bacterium]
MKSKKFYTKAYLRLEQYFDVIVGKEERFEFQDFQILIRKINASDKDYVNKPSILFIHGWGSSMLNWYFQVIDRRFGSYNLFLIDLPGHGRNRDFGSIEEVTHNSYLSILKAYINETFVRKPIIVGHSMGGTLAKRLYDEGLASRAIYINPALATSPLPFILKEIIKKLVIKKDAFKYQLFNKILRNRFILNIWSRTLGDSSSHNTLINEIITIADMYQTQTNAFWGFILNMLGSGLQKEKLKDLMPEELLVVSKNDKTLGKAFIRDYVGNTKKNNVLLSFGGHCSPRTTFEEINKIIISFL